MTIERSLYQKRYSLESVHKDSPSTSLRASPNGKYLATCSSDKSIKIWNSKDGSFYMALHGHKKGISDICWSPDSLYIASGSDDKTIRIWSIEIGKCVRELKGHHYHITTLQFNCKGNLLISGSSDEAIRIWDVLRGKCLKTLSAHSEPISSIDMIWDGTIIASASYDGLIRLFDTESGQCLKTLIYEYRGGSSFPVSYVKFSANGKYILASTLDGSIRLWDHMNNKVIKTFVGPAAHKKISEKFTIATNFITAIEGEPMVISGSEHGEAYIWDLQSKEIVNVLQIDDNSPVLSVEVIDNGEHLAVLSINGTLVFYDLERTLMKDVVMETS